MRSWRVDEFRGLLDKENFLRTKLYRWWLTVWDASGEDYLFDPNEPEDGAWPSPPCCANVCMCMRWVEEAAKGGRYGGDGWTCA